MELINAVLIAGPLGFLVRSRKASLGVWVGIWAIVFPIQTVVVSNDSGLDALYWVINAAILALGIVLNAVGSRLRARRESRRSSAAASLAGGQRRVAALGAGPGSRQADEKEAPCRWP